MIIGSIDELCKNQEGYRNNTNLINALLFLKGYPLEGYVLGKRPIVNGMEINVIEFEQAGEGTRKLEAHRKYIDIHYTISGKDHCGWKEAVNCFQEGEFNTKEDYIFFRDVPSCWYDVLPKQAIIFFPEDAHVALCGNGKIIKAIIKVPID